MVWPLLLGTVMKITGTTGTIKRFAMTLVAAASLLASGAARADILFIDTNDQAIERQKIEELGRKYGERVHIVKGEGPEMEDILRRANEGEFKLPTIVGSGHSSGMIFMGKGGSVYGFDDLLKKYPNVKNGVRHFLGLGCYTGTKYHALEWQTRFPNASVIAGFNGIAPSGTWSARFLDQVYSTIGNARVRAGGTSEKLAERLGDDASSLSDLKRVLSGLSSVNITVGSFVLCEQFYDPKNRSRTVAVADIDIGRRELARYLDPTGWNGIADVPANPHAPSPLRTFYNDLQDYLGSAPSSERDELRKVKDQTIRLIYFNNVKKAWSRDHEADRAAANVALAASGKATIPDAAAMAGMTRKQIIELVNQLQDAKPSVTGMGSDAAIRLIDAAQKQLKDLDVPFSWID